MRRQSFCWKMSFCTDYTIEYVEVEVHGKLLNWSSRFPQPSKTMISISKENTKTSPSGEVQRFIQQRKHKEALVVAEWSRSPTMTKVSGEVSWFSNRKGYGFVTSKDVTEQEEIFVHFSSIVSPDGAYRTLVSRDLWQRFGLEPRRGKNGEKCRRTRYMLCSLVGSHDQYPGCSNLRTSKRPVSDQSLSFFMPTDGRNEG